MNTQTVSKKGGAEATIAEGANIMNVSAMPITEKSGVYKQWYEDAEKQTLETLPEFLRHLLEDYEHDYGTICHALAAGAVATTWAMDKSPHGGITGFQAGAVMWEYMKHWNNVRPPAKLVVYENMLFPQYQHKFEKIISEETWNWLQAEAKNQLAEISSKTCYRGKMHIPHPAVEAHWRNIVAGIVPFGYQIGGD